ncbi:hypothetical protein B0H13DRAFT_2393454 [Mycena leptocephala]|nr:hypothetical protein B0H13DRAFT_2393454 [Mycena leptocephala]
MTLHVSIVGAGIGGLAAAIALRRKGRHVQIFESTEELHEIGAAIVVPLNCQRVMENFGYSKDNLKAVIYDCNILCHRGAFHSELARLALDLGPPPTLCLSIITSDLVLGADGISSAMRTSILGRLAEPISCGWSCYRSLIEMSKLEKIPELAWLHDGVSGARSVSYHGNGPFRWIFMYPCREGTLLNVNAMSKVSLCL